MEHPTHNRTKRLVFENYLEKKAKARDIHKHIRGIKTRFKFELIDDDTRVIAETHAEYLLNLWNEKFIWSKI